MRWLDGIADSMDMSLSELRRPRGVALRPCAPLWPGTLSLLFHGLQPGWGGGDQEEGPHADPRLLSLRAWDWTCPDRGTQDLS